MTRDVSHVPIEDIRQRGWKVRSVPIAKKGTIDRAGRTPRSLGLRIDCSTRSELASSLLTILQHVF